MKAVLISIQPKWCELIARGEKTIEVRKTRPKIETPFKCYIYETKDKKYDGIGVLLENGCNFVHNGGKVIGEFICDKVDCHGWDYNNHGKYSCSDEELQTTCLTREELNEYGEYGKPLFFEHITDLKIYDKPKELSEFWAYNEELHKRYDSEMDFCCYDGSNEYGEPLTDCGDAYNNILNCYRCWEEWSGWCHHVTRPPQSWCYVEELP